jgi:hypothetical protein
MAASLGEKTSQFTPTQATTILAFKFRDGILVAGDRRATAGNTVVYDRAEWRRVVAMVQDQLPDQDRRSGAQDVLNRETIRVPAGGL